MSLSSVSTHDTGFLPGPSVSLSSVGQSVRKVYCDKTAEQTRMPFGVMSGVGRGMGVLDGLVIVGGQGALLGVDLGRPIVTNEDFDA